jgi:hypothetical protein
MARSGVRIRTPPSRGRQKIRRGAVNSGKVRDRSLLAKDFKRVSYPLPSRGSRGSRVCRVYADLRV